MVSDAVSPKAGKKEGEAVNKGLQGGRRAHQEVSADHDLVRHRQLASLRRHAFNDNQSESPPVKSMCDTSRVVSTMMMMLTMMPIFVVVMMSAMAQQ